ncbi:MAG: hypothetical protein KDK39_15260 [Leptospiraceae bacterium]|nr:hypothetical protein [Leptospiraceae bacterium]
MKIVKNNTRLFSIRFLVGVLISMFLSTACQSNWTLKQWETLEDRQFNLDKVVVVLGQGTTASEDSAMSLTRSLLRTYKFESVIAILEKKYNIKIDTSEFNSANQNDDKTFTVKWFLNLWNIFWEAKTKKENAITLTIEFSSPKEFNYIHYTYTVQIFSHGDEIGRFGEHFKQEYTSGTVEEISRIMIDLANNVPESLESELENIK